QRILQEIKKIFVQDPNVTPLGRDLLNVFIKYLISESGNIKLVYKNNKFECSIIHTYYSSNEYPITNTEVIPIISSLMKIIPNKFFLFKDNNLPRLSICS